MSKKFTKTVLCFMLAATIIAWFIKPSPQATKERKNAKTIELQKKLINTQKDLKKSLKNQVDYIRSINEAFGKTVDDGMQPWRDEITTK